MSVQQTSLMLSSPSVPESRFAEKLLWRVLLLSSSRCPTFESVSPAKTVVHCLDCSTLRQWPAADAGAAPMRRCAPEVSSRQKLSRTTEPLRLRMSALRSTESVLPDYPPEPTFNPDE